MAISRCQLCRTQFIVGVCCMALVWLCLQYRLLITKSRGAYMEQVLAALKSQNVTTADTVSPKVRVLCWVMTHPTNFNSKLKAVKETWGPHCDVTLYVSDKYNAEHNTINITVKQGRSHLIDKTMAAFDYIHKHHLNDCDWFLKADDDTYVVVDNLRRFLADKDSSKPVFYGRHLRLPSTPKTQYFSGGAGYVLSRAALMRLGSRNPRQCVAQSTDEDVEVAKCLHLLGASQGYSLDPTGRTLFHCLSIEHHMDPKSKGWVPLYDLYNAQHWGLDAISRYPITFHYASAVSLQVLHFLFYHAHLNGGRANVPTDNYMSSNFAGFNTSTKVKP